MEKKKKVIIMLSIALIMQIIIPLITILPETKLTVFSDAANPTHWDLSSTVTADYNTTTNTLTISGTGNMPDYVVDTETQTNTNPYMLYVYETTKKIEIKEGITGIGDFAFYGFKNIEEIIIPNGVTRIGSKAFGYCILVNKIIVSKSATNIDTSSDNASFLWTGASVAKSNGKVRTYCTSDSPLKSWAEAATISDGTQSFEPYSVTTDDTAPVVTISKDITTPTNGPQVTITINMQDNGVGLGAYCISNSANPPTDFSSFEKLELNNQQQQKVISTSQNMTKYIHVYDAVGNLTTQVIEVNNIDREGPVINSVEKDPPVEYTKGNVTITVNATDDGCGLADNAYSFDGGTTWQASNSKSYDTKTQNILIKVKDKLGNSRDYNEVVNITNIYKFKDISITKAPTKTSYIEGQNFDATGMVISVIYDNNTSKEVTDYTVIDGSNLTVGQTNVTISYTEDGLTKTKTQAITVAQKKLSSIEITKAPTKTSYIEGQNFDATGMVVTATYDNGSTSNVTNYTITDGDNLTNEKTNVTISYTENDITKTTTQNITIVQKKLLGIAITTAPTKIEYIEGQNFDKIGMVVTATYDNGSTSNVTNYTITDGNNLAVGKTSVTISYTEDGVTKTVTQTIIVVKKKLADIEITIEPIKTVYSEGENFDATGMVVKAKYDNNTSKEISNYTLIGGNNLTKGQTRVTVSYEEDNVTKSVQQSITVEKNSVEEQKLGDVNGDGNIDIKDIMAINLHRLGKKTLTESSYNVADVTGDGQVDIRDIMKINLYRLGKISTL